MSGAGATWPTNWAATFPTASSPKAGRSQPTLTARAWSTTGRWPASRCPKCRRSWATRWSARRNQQHAGDGAFPAPDQAAGRQPLALGPGPSGRRLRSGPRERPGQDRDVGRAACRAGCRADLRIQGRRHKGSLRGGHPVRRCRRVAAPRAGSKSATSSSCRPAPSTRSGRASSWPKSSRTATRPIASTTGAARARSTSSRRWMCSTSAWSSRGRCAPRVLRRGRRRARRTDRPLPLLRDRTTDLASRAPRSAATATATPSRSGPCSAAVQRSAGPAIL